MKVKADLFREVTLHRDGKAVRVGQTCDVEIEFPDSIEPNCGIVGTETRGEWRIVRVKTAGST